MNPRPGQAQSGRTGTVRGRDWLGRADRLLKFDDDHDWQISLTDLLALLLVFFVPFLALDRTGPAKPENRLTRTLSARLAPPAPPVTKAEKRDSLLDTLLLASPAWANPAGQVSSDPARAELRQSLLLGHRPGQSPAGPMPEKDLIRPVAKKADSGQPPTALKEILARLQASLNLPDLPPRQEGTSAILSLGSQATFEAGRTELRPDFQDLLRRLAAALKKEKDLGIIRIKGHTDDRPIATKAFPSNWELSGARAARVARFLIDQGLAPEMVEIAGYSHYRPVEEKHDPQARSLNRRVEIELQARPSGRG